MKQEEKKVAAFTGHRKQRLMQENKDYRNFSGQIRGKVITMIKNLYEEGFREFYSGMAEGFDMIAAEAVLQLKEQYEDMTLAAAILSEPKPNGLTRKTSCFTGNCLRRLTG